MPSNTISLKTAFVIAEENNVDRNVFAQDLLRAIEGGAVKALSGEFVKASLAFYFSEDSLENAIRHLSSGSPALNLRAFIGKSNDIRHVPIYESYNTLCVKANRVEVFGDGEFHKRFSGGEINPAYIEHAWIDVSRSCILCDDVDGLSRRIYEKVSLLRTDFGRFMGDATSEPKKRGSKPKLFRQDIIEKAKKLLEDSPQISRESFDEQVKAWLWPLDPGDTQYQKYYGRLWTQHQETRPRPVFK